MNKVDDYYKHQEQMKLNNLRISYNDVRIYDLKPFSLNKPFVKDEHFTCIELNSDNLKLAHKYLKEMEDILKPFKKLYKGVKFPKKISTNYMMNRKLPLSHLRLNPYTANMELNKYPMCLWLTYWNDNRGFDYNCVIEFEQGGTVGKCEFRIDNYTTYIQKDQNGLFVKKIIKVLHEPPYGNQKLYSI